MQILYVYTDNYTLNIFTQLFFEFHLFVKLITSANILAKCF